MTKQISGLALVLAMGLTSQPASQSASQSTARPIRVMILDGESAGAHHRWPVTTKVLKKELDEIRSFAADVVTAPPAGGDFSLFNPAFKDYGVVVLNYDAPD